MWELTRLLHSEHATFYLACGNGIARQMENDAILILRTACCQGGDKILHEYQACLQTSLLFLFLPNHLYPSAIYAPFNYTNTATLIKHCL